jgi:hypothetical protein
MINQSCIENPTLTALQHSGFMAFWLLESALNAPAWGAR